ncbi:hypothetical protein N7516_008138 [Penicillium verrucosum]|uniref:uncharacterized protein n=1 Tax=Penicillium verrucosum TaxID=60171 RepID=UPI00254537B0|nr:uncharacterized protein N7516_008138 [Penicillium verrucosum]KAJ5926365.1 hypothetical protein N7516_008138 [Penicillium verrucosum]
MLLLSSRIYGIYGRLILTTTKIIRGDPGKEYSLENLYGYIKGRDLIEHLFNYRRLNIEERLNTTYTAPILLELNKAFISKAIIYYLVKVRNSEDTESYKRILAIISIVYRPIAFDELPSIIKLPNNLFSNTKALSEIIAIYSLFLTIREDTIIFIYYSRAYFSYYNRKKRNYLPFYNKFKTYPDLFDTIG